MIIMEEAAKMAVAQWEESAGASLLFLAKIQVTIVLETNPPTIPVNKMPRSCPKNLINKYPKKPNPEVRIMIHLIYWRLTTQNGPIPSTGIIGRINKDNNNMRIIAYISNI